MKRRDGETGRLGDIMNNKRLCVLIILDGWGLSESQNGNAVFFAKTACLDKLADEYPNTRLLCAGKAVGLPDGIIGNSEVGHLNIGAGRVVYQDLLRIDKSIEDGKFFQNSTLISLIKNIKKNNSALHLLGLLSDAGVHSHINHIFALLDMAKENRLNRVYVHPILDGRDTPPDSGAEYLKRLQSRISTKKIGKIATICGRFYAMDRDNRWERVEKAFNLYTNNIGTKQKDPVKAVKTAYSRGETDEFVQPVLLTNEDDKPIGTIQDGDGVIFFNFRADRAKEIIRAFTEPDFQFFKRKSLPKLSQFVCMTQYDENFKLPVAFPPLHLDGILGEVISKKGLNQLRIAETEKYAHVTYFFNGGEEKPFPHEDRCLILSPREIPTYDLKPEMSAYKVTDEVISRIKSNKYDLIVINFANLDMVGHTGNFNAAVLACQAVDACINKIIPEIKAQDGIALITADHGNAEKMKDENGKIYTAHTLNPVPFILVDDRQKNVTLRPGRLGDIAPTILELMGIKKPKNMTGTSLIEK